MRSLGEYPTPQELKEIISEADENKNGSIDFHEFLGLMGARRNPR
jgi:Ca2+-binding EF-hand superfamily protein